MEVVLCLDPALYLADRTREGLERHGQIASKVFVGEPQVRDFSEQSRRTYQTVLEDFGESTNKLSRWEAFVNKTEMALNTFRMQVPVEREYSNLLCYPKADGANTFFDIPAQDVTEAVATIDDVYSPAADWTLWAAANLVPKEIASLEEDAAPADRGHAVFGTCTIARRIGLSAWGVAAILVDPTGSVGNVGIVAGGAYGSAYKIPVSGSTAYDVVFFVRGSGSFRVVVKDYDTGDVLGDSTTGGGVAGSSSAWTAITADHTTASDADYVTVTCERTTVSANDFFVDCIGVVPDGYGFWHYPPCAPSLIEFGSAPADTSWVRMSGSATALVPRLRIDGTGVLWTLSGGGDAISDMLKTIEAFE